MSVAASARGWVAAGNPHTAQAAVRAFEGGGNAVDAAVAAGLASFVAEPLLASAGGGGLMLVADADAPTACLDFFPRAPGLGASRAGGPDFGPVDIDFGAATQRFFVGRASACMPTVLPAFAEAVARHGRLPLAVVAEAAIELARDGVEIGPSGAEVFALLWPIVTRDESTLRSLLGSEWGSELGSELRPEPSLLDLGAHTRTRNPDFANFLRAWALEPEGDAKAAVAAAVRACAGIEAGGSLTAADIEAARPRWRACKQLRVPTPHGLVWELDACPLPGGDAVRSMVARLSSVPATAPAASLAVALADAGVHADRERLGQRSRGSTTHISTLDAQGQTVSMTLSNGEGCGHVLEGLGILLNNFMGEADLNPHGHFQHEAGAVLPTMMSPCIARAPGHRIALGSGGANRIRSAVTRVLDAYAVRGMNMAQAVAAPRVHAEGDEVWFELGGGDPADEQLRAELATRFGTLHPFDGPAFFFGGVHAVASGPMGVEAVGDLRRAGAAAVAQSQDALAPSSPFERP